MTMLTMEKLQPIQILFVLDQKLQSKNPFSQCNATFVFLKHVQSIWNIVFAF